MNAVTLSEWCENHNLTFKIRKDILIISGWGRALIQDKYEHIFKVDREGNVLFNPIENLKFLIEDNIEYIVFPFGNRWFYVGTTEDMATCQFKILRYVGDSPKFEHECDFVPLGIHTGYELLNGSGALKDWCSKAKFLGYKGIGIADKNTMAATLDLQLSATSKEMKFAFGYSLDIRIGDDKVGAIIYAASQRGFRNMLRIQKAIGVDNVEKKEIDVVELLNRAEGNIIVFNKWQGEWLSNHSEELKDFIDSFGGWVFFQMDLSEYKADRFDSALLLSQKAFFDNFYLGDLEYKENVRPILIQDWYYLDKEDWKTKINLNKIDIGSAHEQSQRQYMKTIDEMYNEFRRVFSEKYSDDIFYDACSSTLDIAENAVAQYDLTENYAPEYIMTPKEVKKYGTKLNMFNEIIEQGFKRLVPDGESKVYRERVNYEKYVILSTDNLDYFLITYDEMRWAQQNGILTGIGRGSAGGCLVLYLMGITFIDPLKYNLIFERFLLPERGGLGAMDVTKFDKDRESEAYVTIELENGKKITLDKDSLLLIKRKDEELIIYADEIEDGDDIRFDRIDELHNDLIN